MSTHALRKVLSSADGQKCIAGILETVSIQSGCRRTHVASNTSSTGSAGFVTGSAERGQYDTCHGSQVSLGVVQTSV